MEGDLSQYIGFLGVPFILALVELVKKVSQDKQGNDRLPKQVIPALGVLFGLVINIGLAYYQHIALVPALFLGLATGLVAGGLYSGVKALVGR